MVPIMNRLDTDRRSQVVRALVDGCSIRATVRMTGAAKGTVLKLLADLGAVCSEYQDKALRNLTCKRIECDETWSFCGAKQKNVAKGAAGVGDVWTWTAICADTKLVPSWMIGGRDGEYAKEFIADLASRLTNRVQLTTDGHKAYLEAVEAAFGCDVDYAMLIKKYANEGGVASEVRYSPAACTGIEKKVITGNPDKRLISTSYVERQNLTMRMGMRRFTRLTNGFSKKVENTGHAVAIHFMNYNYCRVHQSLRVTPAMAAGVTDHVWDVEDVIALLVAAEDAREAELGPRRTRGPRSN